MTGQDAWMGNVQYPSDALGNKNFTLTGTEEVLRNLDQYIAKVPELIYGELELYAEKILSESKKEVPWDTTHLRMSGTVEPYNEGDFVGFEIGYAAFAGEYNYGLKQHEDLTLHHPKPGTKAKYLEDPFNRIKAGILPGIVRTMDWAFSQGIPGMEGMKASQRANLGNLGGRFV
jgi:hypothetical protein